MKAKKKRINRPPAERLKRPGPVEKHAGGRPPKLTEQVIETICNFLRSGAYLETACSAAGVQREAKFEWLRRGADAKAKIDAAEVAGKRPPKLTDYEKLCIKFSYTCEKTEAESELGAITQIRIAGKESWQALAWLVERKYSKRWGRKDFVQSEVSGPDGKAIQSEVKIGRLVPDEHLEKLVLEYAEELRAKAVSNGHGQAVPLIEDGR